MRLATFPICTKWVAFAVIFATAALTRAETVTFSTGDNLTNLSVGDTFTITINLSGFTTNVDTPLGFLSTDVAYESAYIGAPTSFIPGAIAPDATGFDGTSSVGGNGDRTISRSYDDLAAASGDPIQSNGSFFSFAATATAVGSGSIRFTAAAAQDDNGSDVAVTPVGFLPFDIHAPDPAGAPLPGAGLGAAVLCAFVALRRARSLA